MKTIKVMYGRSYMELNLHFDRIDVLLPKPIRLKSKSDEERLVTDSLNQPITKGHIKADFCKKKIAITINDVTRPIPYHKTLPQLLKYLEKHGADISRIEYYIAAGTHRPLSSSEIDNLIPYTLVKHNQIFNHNCDDSNNLQQIGFTTRNTPVIINSGFLGADIKIVTGNIEPHHFMGYSGGVKSACIGLAGRETIEKNHQILLDPLSRIGTFCSNPMRMDVEEMGAMIPIDLAFNMVQNHNMGIEACLFGDPYLVMKEGIDISKKKTQVDSSNKYDLVIASPGGFPRDINLYQAQKAISNACLFARKNGVIIIIAACEEGSGNKDFEDFIKSTSSLVDLMEKFSSTPFKIGPHKAYLLGQQAMDHHIIMVSSFHDTLLEKINIKSAACFDDALMQAQKIIGNSPQAAVLPFATHCIPSQFFSEIN